MPFGTSDRARAQLAELHSDNQKQCSREKEGKKFKGKKIMTFNLPNIVEVYILDLFSEEFKLCPFTLF
jgi:hypothetical protein